MTTRADQRKRPGERSVLRRSGAGFSVVRPLNQPRVQLRSLSAEDTSKADEEIMAALNELGAFISGEGFIQKVSRVVLTTGTHQHDASEITSGQFSNARISETSVTQHEGAIDHDALTNFVTKEHLDWTADQGANNILVENTHIPTVHKDADYTVTVADCFVSADCTTADVNLTLPTASAGTGRIFYFKRTDGSGNNVLVTADGAETIDGNSNYTLTTQYQNVNVISDGTEWWIA